MSKWGRPSNVVVLIGLFGLIALVFGLYLQSSLCLAGGAVAICATALSLRISNDTIDAGGCSNDSHLIRKHPKGGSRKRQTEPVEDPLRSNPVNTEALVEEMLDDGRFALLIRPQIVGNLDADQFERSKTELDETMCLVPTGPVLLRSGEGYRSDDDWAPSQNELIQSVIAGRIVFVEPLFLDRHPVTNREYQRFVDGGGYEQLAIWHEESLPALIDFVDQSGVPGPRFWMDGTYAEGEENHPVVGVSWYEAWAFARWAGKRLPTDAEWVKAGAWPVESSPGCLSQRRFPWGETFDAARANIWGSGPNGTVDVDRYTGGMSVGGVGQLIGNIWEWTASPFGDPDDTTLRLVTPMKAIRGGAYDTYFENQATCHFQSGEGPLARRHNIGFRLAIGICDLAPEATGLFSQTPEEPVERATDHASESTDDLVNDTEAERETAILVEETV